MLNNLREQSLSKIIQQNRNNASSMRKLHGSFQQLYELLSRQVIKPNTSKIKNKIIKTRQNNNSHQKSKIQYSAQMIRKDRRVDIVLNNTSLDQSQIKKCHSQAQSILTSKRNTTEVKRGNVQNSLTTQQKLKSIIFGNKSKEKNIYLTSKNSLRQVSLSYKQFHNQSKLLGRQRCITQNTPQNTKVDQEIENAKNNLKRLKQKASLACYYKEATSKHSKQEISPQKESIRLKLQKYNRKFTVRGDHLNKLPVKANRYPQSQEVHQSQEANYKSKQSEKANYEKIYCKRSNASQVRKQTLKQGIISIEIKNSHKKSQQSLIEHYCMEQLSSQHVMTKIVNWVDFTSFFLANFSCKHHVMFNIYSLPKYSRKHELYSYYVGPGNNRNLIVQILNKRWWFKQVDKIQGATFVWSQIKIDSIFNSKPIEENEMQSEPKIDEKIKKKSTSSISKHSLPQNLLKSYKSIQLKRQNQKELKIIKPPSCLHNHLRNSCILGNKKSLFNLLKKWTICYKQRDLSDLFDIIPETYHIVSEDSSEFRQFQLKFKIQQTQQNLWIVKPGQNSNRGRDIFISSSFDQIVEAVKTRSAVSGTTIVQKYKTDLLLYNGRKFDIRTFMLCIFIGGQCKFYWFSLGYIRTSSHQFNLGNMDNMIHLTNDAIQIQGQQYGKFQKGNKLSYHQLQNYLKSVFPQKQWKIDSLVQSMKDIAKNLAQASYNLVEKADKQHGFELFGLDFIVDNEFKPWLLEVNTNPCLQLTSPLLQTLIPSLIENTFRLAVDPLFPPTMLPDKERQYSIPDKIIQTNKFQLLFDSSTERDKSWQTFCLEDYLTK